MNAHAELSTTGKQFCQVGLTVYEQYGTTEVVVKSVFVPVIVSLVVLTVQSEWLVCQLHVVHGLVVMCGSARGWSEWGSCGLTCGFSRRMRVRHACVPTVGRPRCRDDEREAKREVQFCRMPPCPCTLRLHFHIFLAVMYSSPLSLNPSPSPVGLRLSSSLGLVSLTRQNVGKIGSGPP